MNIASDKKLFSKTLISFFIFGSLFPTLRVFLVGTEAYSGFSQLIISVLPEIFTVFLIVLLFIYIYRNSGDFSFTTFDYILICYLLVNIILGCIIGGDPKLSAYAIRLSYLPVIFYFFGRYIQPFNKVFLDKFLHWVLYWLTAISLIGILLYFAFPSLNADLIRWSGGRLMEYHIPRMTSIFWSPVLFAPFVSFGALFCYFNIQQRNELKYYLCFTVFCTCLYFCVSRGPLVTFIIGFIALSVIFKQWKRFFICIAIIASLYLFFSLVIYSFDKMVLWIFSSTMDTLLIKKGITRVELFIRTVHDLQVNPFGYGFGKAGILATRFFTEDTPGISYYSTDCWYLKIACETGILGIISYLVLIGNYSWSVGGYLMKNKNEMLLLFIFLFFILFNIENVVHNLPDFFLLSNFYLLLAGFGQNYITLKHD